MKLISGFLIFSALVLAFPSYASDAVPNEVYKRVVKTMTLKCAYTIYPTYFEKDPNTGKYSGISYDFMEELGKALNIKIEWTEEVGTDTLFQGLGTRYDANCTGYFQTPARTFGGDFSKPFMFLPSNMYVRIDEKRFNTFDDVNKEGVKIVFNDGEMWQAVINEQFSKATPLGLSGLTPATDRFENVISGKADVTFTEAAIAEAYMKANPGKIKQIGKTTWRADGAALILPHDEYSLKRMLDVAIDSLLWTGTLERVIKKHEKYPGTILPPRKDFD